MVKKFVTPSVNTITAEQICQIQGMLGSALRRSGFLSESVHRVVSSEGEKVIEEFLTSFRKRLEAIDGGMIVRHVKDVVGDTFRTILEKTGRKLFMTESVVVAVLREEDPVTAVYFFKLDLMGGCISDDELEKEYAQRNLRPASPYALAAVNQAEPEFADLKPNCTHWKDKDNNWCYIAFRRSRDVRRVRVGRDNDSWSDGWFFAGVRK